MGPYNRRNTQRVFGADKFHFRGGKQSGASMISNSFDADDYGYYDQQEPEPVIYSGMVKHMQIHFNWVLSQLYGKTPIDLKSLEFSLDELAFGLGVPLPEGDPKIERQRDTYYDFHRNRYDFPQCAVANN